MDEPEVSETEEKRQYKMVIYFDWDSDEVREVMHSWSQRRLIRIVNLIGDVFPCKIIDTHAKPIVRTVYESYRQSDVRREARPI